MGKRRLCAFSIGCAVLAASPSWAAVVQPGFGNLTINQGQGFKPVATAVNANVGDSVMVGPGGSATIVYEDGCKVDVRPGAVTTIAPLSPCASGSNAQTTPDCKQWPDGQWYWIGPNGVHHPCEPPNSNDWVGPALAAALAAAGFGIAAYEASKGNGTTAAVQQPASP
jgi:hypothetical protein